MEGRPSEFTCRKCRTTLFKVEDVIHGVDRSNVGTAGEVKAKWARNARGEARCTSVFVGEAPSWCDGDDLCSNSGTLCCGKCGTRVGNYSWSGSTCSCGHWVAPAFQFQLSKVDRKIELDLSGMMRNAGDIAAQSTRVMKTGRDVSGKV